MNRSVVMDGRNEAINKKKAAQCAAFFCMRIYGAFTGQNPFAQEKGRAGTNRLSSEVMPMLAAAWLIFSSLLYSLQLSTGSFPKTLSEEEERYYLKLAGEGNLEARNVLIERNLRLVAHIMKKY